MKKSRSKNKAKRLLLLAAAIAMTALPSIDAHALDQQAPVSQGEIEKTQKDQIAPQQMKDIQNASTNAINNNPLANQYPPAPKPRREQPPAIHLNPFQGAQAQQPQPQQPQQPQPPTQGARDKRGKKDDKKEKSGPPERKMISDLMPKLKTEGDEKEPGNKAEDRAEWLKKTQRPPQIIYDEGYQPAIISLKEITRVVCFAPITRTIYSKEKPFEIKTLGRDAYIKNIPFEVTDPIDGTTSHQYDDHNKEIYMVCGDKTYSLILIPSDIPAQTIYLKTTTVDKEVAKQGEKSLPYEDSILSLIRDAYTENIPDGYDVQENGAEVRNYEQVNITHTKTYTGASYQVLEFLITAKTDVNLDEIAFLSTIQPKNPLAVSLLSLQLKQGEQTRAFIVRAQKDE